MEKDEHKNSMYGLQFLLKEIHTIKEAIKNKQFYSTDIYLMDEAQALQFLKISRSTWYKYKKVYKINAISVFGRSLFLKHQIIEVLIKQILK